MNKHGETQFDAFGGEATFYDGMVACFPCRKFRRNTIPHSTKKQQRKK